MPIKKGTVLDVKHSRSGSWIGIATADFDTEKDEWYPIALHQDQPVVGMTTTWHKGKEMPCRSGLCEVTLRV